LVITAVAFLAGGVFLLGEQNNLFRAKLRYNVRFISVGGLQEGNPVQLNGVHVGTVHEVLLPEDPMERGLIVTVKVDARYRERIREDSQARIKTLGLLGDKFIELTSGSPQFPVVPDGGEIATAEATDVDKLLATGEDVAENIVSISVSLKDNLGRRERGEGMLGELMQTRQPGEPGLADTLNGINEAVSALTEGFKTGGGPVPRMLHDEVLGEQVASMLARFERLSAELETGEGPIQTLLRDTSLRDRLVASIENLEQATVKLRTAAEAFEGGDGLLPRLLNDAELAENMTQQIQRLLERLNTLTGKLTEGDGTIAKLLDDPSIYEALNDVVIGIDESKMLRWLIRNRQKAGIKKRYRDARSQRDAAGASAPPPATNEQEEPDA
jgi:phospholipid/cholesterol/gamma-HCH transport system substrate-binding protein